MKTNRKSMFLIAALLVIVGLAFPIVVSAQASTTPVVLYTYDGAPIEVADASARDAGIQLGGASAVCSQTLVGQNCTMTIGGTTAAMWIEVMPASAVPAVTLTSTATSVVPGTVITPTATPNPLLGQGGGAVVTTGLPTATSSVTQSGWTVQYFTGATADMLAYQFPVLNPLVWGSFPNVDNSAAGFLAANGLEYGEDESQTCGAADDACDLVVAARSYVIITGDYALDGIGSCTASNGRGCAIMITNVGDVSASLTGTLDNVFIIQGRYWNGDRNFLPGAIVAGLSHASHNMLNLNSALNPTGASNAGANCSVPGGCISVDVRGVVTSGNQPLVAISTIANR